IQGDNVHWFFSLNPDIKDHRRQHTELAIAFMQNAIKMAAGENWAATEVHFEHIPWGKKREMEEVFQTSLNFSKENNSLIFPKKLMCLPIKEKTPVTENINSDFFSSSPNGNFAPVLKQVLKPLALEGRPKMSEISTMMDLSSRTIQRFLAKEGTNFRTLVDQVCFERGADLLTRGTKNLLQVALMQGYSEGASLSRAFKRWAGVTPSEYRSMSFEEEFQNLDTRRDF
ncbi:MAG: helix-turn-helix domain-containing protein, partial [Sphingomonadales bacterium]